MKSSCINFPRVLCLAGMLIVMIQSVWAQQITTFVLVRHAEKVADGSKDPELTADGHSRAIRFGDMFEKTSVDAIYTTAYKRTRSTVEPLAKAKGMTIAEYTPGKVAVVDEMLSKHAGKTIVLSGHSNTIPEIANWLTGSTQFRDFDDSDYGNILIISVVSKGNARVVWLRY